ncbi:helix-turn-helix transcriptional regulator [Gardnerella sp. 2492-Sm]|uniref:helix-turn-helix transcriptional regulator n=1 Tax=unclassified Gardnerella TaxID=2628112 RepID=UPI003D060316
MREFRKKKGLTQYQLAKAVGLTRRGILVLEKGDSNTKLEHAARLAYVLQVDIEELFCVSDYVAEWSLSAGFDDTNESVIN